MTVSILGFQNYALFPNPDVSVFASQTKEEAKTQNALADRKSDHENGNADRDGDPSDNQESEGEKNDLALPIPYEDLYSEAKDQTKTPPSSRQPDDSTQKNIPESAHESRSESNLTLKPESASDSVTPAQSEQSDSTPEKPESVNPVVPSRQAPDSTVSTQPNIIVLTADDLGIGDVSCYYSRDLKTPRIDSIARQGLRLGWFCTPISEDKAAQRALLTGTRFLQQIESQNLGKTAQQNRYQSCFLGQWLLAATDNQLPSALGFDSFWGITVSPDQSPFHPVADNTLPPQKLYDNNTIIGYNPNLGVFSDALADHAIQFIRRSAGAPFYLHVAFTAPHVPLQIALPENKPDSAETNARGLYGESVKRLDAAVGRILDALEQEGLTKQSLVVFLSDNGPWLSYGTHAGNAGPLREGKGTCWEGGVRVPCVLQWPEVIPPQSNYNHFTTTLDLSLGIAQLLSGQASLLIETKESEQTPTEQTPTESAIESAIESGDQKSTEQDVSPESFPVPESFSRAEGVSLLPVLSGRFSKPLDSRPFVYYLPNREIGAVRVGNWKIVRPHEYPHWDSGQAAPNDGKPGAYTIKRTGWEAYSLKTTATAETKDEAATQQKLINAVKKALNE